MRRGVNQTSKLWTERRKIVTLPWLYSQTMERTDLWGNIIIYLQDMRCGRHTQYFSKLDGSAAFWQSHLDKVKVKMCTLHSCFWEICLSPVLRNSMPAHICCILISLLVTNIRERNTGMNQQKQRVIPALCSCLIKFKMIFFFSDKFCT